MFTSAVRCLPHSDFAGYPASCRIRDIWPDMDYGQWLDTGFLAVWYFTTYKIINTHLAFFISSTFLASVSKRPKCIRYTGTIRDSVLKGRIILPDIQPAGYLVHPKCQDNIERNPSCSECFLFTNHSAFFTHCPA